jgi:hypothetical protein
MFAAALAFLWSFYTKADTPFYRWLDEKGAFKVYVSATIYVIGINFMAIAALIVARHINGVFIGITAAFFLALAIINLYTFVSNVAGIMRLNAKFSRMRHDI